jgi:hypothetical protein
MPAQASDFFEPIVRFAGHAAASTVGFVVLAVATLVIVYVLKGIVLLGLSELANVLQWLESGILYLDICIYVASLILWTFVWIVEEFRAARKALGW